MLTPVLFGLFGFEFGSTIWSGAAVSHTTRLEKVQHKFLIWLAVNSNRPSDSLDYAHLLRHFDVLRINQRLVQHDLTFLHGVFGNPFDCVDILGMFSLAVPARRTRTRPVLNVPATRVETVKNGLFCRLPRQAVCARRYPVLICSAIAASLSNVCLCLSVEQCKVFILFVFGDYCLLWQCAPHIYLLFYFLDFVFYWVYTPVDGYKINTNTNGQ